MLKDRVQETISTSFNAAATSVTLDGATTGYQAFSTFGTGATNLFYYVITQDALWEAGIGYLSAANTMVRNSGAAVILASSSGGAAVNFSTSTSVRYIFNTTPAERYTNWRDANLERPVMKNYAETISAVPVGGSPRTIDLSLGNVHTYTKTGNTQFNFSGTFVAGRAYSFTFILTNGGNGPISWGSTIKWSYGIVPTFTTTGVDIVTFMTIDAGASWHGMLASADSKQVGFYVGNAHAHGLQQI